MTRVRLIWAALAVAVLGFEGYTVVTPEPGDTLSEQVWAASDRWSLVPLLAGLLAGHFFWPRKR
jgi:hypothetical protein